MKQFVLLASSIRFYGRHFKPVDLAQNGLAYTKDPFDAERFHRLQALAAEMAAAHTNAPFEPIHNLFVENIGHATPKMDVRGVVFRSGKLLLVREKSDGGWTLPGGWVEVGETPSEAVEKEVWEESGFRTKAIKLLAFYDRDKQGHPPHAYHIYKALFLCEIVGGAAQTSSETTEVAFFERKQIPSDLSFSRILPKQIERLFDQLAHPEWPTDFD
ncbi:MAG: NUDIX hydrolase N-terminal domain-containing protein [Anaerolineales bacterium]|nr:NUDIX hydrolase N-terminal domain-containing protein [Anaerolineales bacterium]